MRTCLLVLVAACAPRHDPGPIPVQRAAEPVRLLERPAAGSPNVYLQAIVAAGSAYDPVGKEGLAHLVGRSLVDAGGGDLSSDAVREALYPTGNRFQVVVDREWVSVRLRCHVDHEALCVELFADALVRPRFDAPDVLRLRDKALYDVTDGMLSDEEALGHNVLETQLFDGHPYGHPIEGRAGVLPLLDATLAADFHRQHYVREAVVAGIAGGYSDAAAAAFRERLAALPGTRGPELVLQKPLPLKGRSLVAVDTVTEVTGVHFGHPVGLTRAHDDYPSLYVAMTALGAHRQSFGRLFRTLRTARGLNYGDYAYIEPYVQRGWSPLPEQGVLRRQPYFYVWIRPTSLENGPFALKMAVAEIERFVADGLTEAELDDTREHLSGYMALLAQDPGRRLAYALDAEAAGVPDILDAVPAALDGMTVEAVNAAIQRHVQPDTLRFVVVTGQADAFLDRLLEESETTIVYADVTPEAEQAARDAEVAAWPLALDREQTWTLEADGVFR